MKLEIISPEGIIYSGEADSVSFPGVAGVFDVWPRHAPLIAALQQGTIHYRQAGETQGVAISGGFVEVKDDRISACIERQFSAGKQ